MINATNINDLSDWLRKSAWPLWLKYGVDRERGGFLENLDPKTLTSTADFRRLRVVARQTYVFGQAYREGLEGAEEAVLLGMRYLQEFAQGEDGGFAWRFSLDNQVIDGRRDLYDHAFVLLALSSAFGVLPREVLHEEARRLLRYIQEKFVHPFGGFVESLPPAFPRRQNPHMHLLEALMSACETFGDTSFLDAARPVVDLFARKFYLAEPAVLAEEFTDRLDAIPGGDGVFAFEPGHHCEWVWLLDWYQSYAGPDPLLAHISHKMMAQVDRCAQTFGLPDQVTGEGVIIGPQFRLWPQTERLKAEILRAEYSPEHVTNAVMQLASWLHPSGLWDERRDAQGAVIAMPAPASSLYHITCAILTAEQNAE